MDTDLEELEDRLAPAVSQALDEQDPEKRLSDLQAAILVVFLAAFLAAGGDEDEQNERATEFVDELTPSLRLLEPDPENRDAQQQRVQSWLATATLGASTLSAAASNSPNVTKTWITQRDERVREVHGILDGTTVAAAEFFTVKTDPPARLSYPGQPVGPPEAWINCVAENSQIAWTGQDVLGSTRRDYSGPLVDLVTEDGHRLTVTPNHPVLTTRGYVDAGTLAPGDQVLATPQPVTPEVTDAPPSAKEFHRAASKLWSKQRVRGSRMDFHGDGTENEVEVVRPHGDLTTPTGEPGELVFVGTSVGQSLLSGSRPPEQPGSGVGVLAAGPPSEVADFEGSRSLVGSKGVGPPFSGSHPAHTQPVSLGAVALDEAELPHPALDGPARDPESIAHLQDAHALGMKPSKLIQVHLYAGTTFVHNLHTSRNHYSANGIQVHNCRCKLQVDADPMVAAAESGEFSGAVLVALPEGDGTVTYNDGDTTQLHQTIAWLGDAGALTVEQRADLVLAAEELASEMAPFEARVAGLATLGDGQDAVAITESVELQWLRDAAIHNDVIGPIVAAEDTHPTWISHVTGLDAKPGDTIQYDRVAIWFGADDHTEFAMTGEALVASRGPGWVTDPEDTARLHTYWTKGEGAAKIRWGTNGDFTRCTEQLAKYIEPPFLKRTCAEWHHDALGYWPGELGKPGNPPDTKENRQRAAQHASAAPCMEEPMSTEITSIVGEANTNPFAVTAAADTPKMPPPPREWFDDPKLDGPTALVVQADGRVYGHIATWGQCHIGIDGECVTAPRSASGYAYAHTGVADTSEGEVPVGVLTMGTGHADRYATASATVEHYDHTGTQAAKVRFGEDKYGIWAAGSMNLMDEGDFGRFKAASVSGDWRSIAGRLELVAALMVNVPGFPVPRPALAASGDRVTSAVGLNQVTHDGDLTESVAAAVVAQLDRRDKRLAKLADLAPIDQMVRERKLAQLDD